MRHYSRHYSRARYHFNNEGTSANVGLLELSREGQLTRISIKTIYHETDSDSQRQITNVKYTSRKILVKVFASTTVQRVGKD